MRTLSVVLGLFLLGGCAHTIPAVRGEPAPVGRAWWKCSEPAPWVAFRVDYFNHPLIREHEQIHVEQMRRYGCAEWNRKLVNPVEREALETEAACEAYRRVYGQSAPDCKEG